jgi:hypothetical protein
MAAPVVGGIKPDILAASEVLLSCSARFQTLSPDAAGLSVRRPETLLRGINSMKTNATEQSSLTPLQTGQVWQLADSHLRIGLVGRTLVHYKHYKGLAGISGVSLKQGALEKFLEEHKAVLLQEPSPAPRPGATGRQASAVRSPRGAE